MKGADDYRVDYGIYGLDTNRSPDARSFPARFNRRGEELWRRLFEDQEFQRHTRSLSPNEAWKQAVNRYLEKAAEENVSPFEQSLINKNNDLVTADLTRKRRALVRFINLHMFFDHFRIAGAVRSYVFGRDGMSLTTTAPLKPQSIEDGVVEWLRSIDGPRFFRAMENMTWERKLIDGTLLQFHLRTRLSGHFAYTLYSEYVPTLSIDKAPSHVELVQFMDEHIWLPIVWANRMKNVGSRPF